MSLTPKSGTTDSPPGVDVLVERLTKRFATAGDAAPAVDDISFEIIEGEFFTLLGPSGCGKTTTLRCVAGLEEPERGRIVLGGAVVADLDRGLVIPSHRRNIGMVFQSYAVWPHMTVFANVAFPLRLQRPRLGKQEVRRRVQTALAAVRLDAFESRMATQLSGGQQQRLALARALVRRPRLLLLDEPLSNLDAKLRDEMRAELIRLKTDFGLTILYVTHDQSEALAMSSRIAVMDQGRIVQNDTPRAVYEQPANAFVANFVGRTNFLEGEVAQKVGGALTSIRTPSGAVLVGGTGWAVGSKVTVAIRPEALSVLPRDGAGVQDEESNVFTGCVVSQNYFGSSLEIRLDLGQGASLDVIAPSSMRCEIGETLSVACAARDCVAMAEAAS